MLQKMGHFKSRLKFEMRPRQKWQTVLDFTKIFGGYWPIQLSPKMAPFDT